MGLYPGTSIAYETPEWLEVRRSRWQAGEPLHRVGHGPPSESLGENRGGGSGLRRAALPIGARDASEFVGHLCAFSDRREFRRYSRDRLNAFAEPRRLFAAAAGAAPDLGSGEFGGPGELFRFLLVGTGDPARKGEDCRILLPEGMAPVGATGEWKKKIFRFSTKVGKRYEFVRKGGGY